MELWLDYIEVYVRIELKRRRERFVEEFNSEILKYEGKEWIVISKISLKDLFDDNKGKDIFYDLLISILKAMLLVEGIGEMEV